jgi:YVTN family beta-propeller protein
LTERSNSIAITPDGGTAFVANYGSDTVTPIRTVSRRAGRPIPVGKQPRAIAIPEGGYVGQALAGLRLRTGLPWRVLNLAVSVRSFATCCTTSCPGCPPGPAW